MGSNESVIPEHWREIATVAKEPIGWPTWPEIVLPKPRPKTASRNDLNTGAGNTTQIILPLARLSGEGIEGARIRITAWPFRRQFDVTATMEAPGGRSFVTIARLDAWPPDPHENVSRPHRQMLGVPAQVIGHHIHRFEDNARVGREAFAPFGNLPIARPIEGPIDSFRQFLDMVGKEFRIEGLADWPPPEWGELI